ncbi:MAG: hypothetical protein U0Z26_15430 [Anaerolineales bacterium]
MAISKVNSLFSARTEPSYKLTGTTRLTLQMLQDKFGERFGANHGISIATTEEFWTDVTIDQARTPLADVLNFVMTSFSVSDVRITWKFQWRMWCKKSTTEH